MHEWTAQKGLFLLLVADPKLGKAVLTLQEVPSHVAKGAH